MAIRSRYAHSPDSEAKGKNFQDFVVRVALMHGIVIQQYVGAYGQLHLGESVGGHEIKLDTPCTDTGRLSIEIAEKSEPGRPDFVASGIYAATRPLFYIQGNYTAFWYFATRDLIDYHRLYVRSQGKGNRQWDELPTIRKFYMSLADADANCLKKFVVRPDGQYSLFDHERRQP